MSVIDLWSVPDYDRFFSCYINPDMQRYAKLEWSQLQIVFEATDACEKYPLGVKVSFWAYSSDGVSLIKQRKVVRILVPQNDSSRAFQDLQTLENELNTNNPTQKRLFSGIIVDENDDKDDLEARGIDAETLELINSIGYEPVKVEINEFEGQGNCFVLKSIPSESTIYLQPFVEGFRADLEKINNTVQSKLSHFDNTVREWNTFEGRSTANRWCRAVS